MGVIFAIILVSIFILVIYFIYMIFMSLAGFSQRREYGAQIERAKRALIKSRGHASLPRLAPDEYRYRPVGKEALLGIQDDVSEQKSQVTGRLLVTDKAIVFEGRKRNDRIPLGQVADVEFHINGITISKRNGPAKVYLISRPDPKFAVILRIILSRVD